MTIFIKKKIPGILLCLVIAIAATVLGGLKIGEVKLDVIGAPVFAILIGMIITLCSSRIASSDFTKDGIKFTSKKILQWAVIILGFSLFGFTIVVLSITPSKRVKLYTSLNSGGYFLKISHFT